MERSVKRSIASLISSVVALLVALSGTAYAQGLPYDDVHESHDPDRAAEVERKAEAISGQSVGGSGGSADDTSETTEPATMPAESQTPGEARSEGESGGTQQSSEPQLNTPPLPENSGEIGGEAPYGGGGNDGKTNKSNPAGTGETYH